MTLWRTGIPGVIAGGLILLSLSACQATNQEPAETSLAQNFDAVGQTSTSGLLAACGGSEPRAVRARDAIRSWYEVMRHLDECDLSRVRYYTSTVNRRRIEASLDQVSSTGSSECRADVASVHKRFRSTVDELRGFLKINWTYCMIDYREDVLDKARADFQSQVADTQCRVARLFPEMIDNPGAACAAAGSKARK